MSTPPPDIRISDADRERAAARLQQAMAEGRITVVELEERLGQVYAARFAADLAPPLADLPGGAVTGTDLTVRPSSVIAAAGSAEQGESVVLQNSSATLRRRGDWLVPARIEVQNRSGAVVLDFCDTHLLHPVVRVEVDNRSGTVKLLVPDDATADLDGMRNSSGSVRSALDARPRPGVPHFVVVGRNRSGAVVVRRRFRFAGRYF